jgi:protoporphyrinogen oxidase
VVVLGAGLGGLSAAWVLQRAGYSVTLVEKTEVAGGLAISKQRGGFRYDLGPHNLHSVHRHILEFLARTFPKSWVEHALGMTLLKRGRYVPYPLRGVQVLAMLPWWKLPLAAVSFFLARVRMFVRWPKHDASFFDWITNRFGAVLYGEYFGPYAEKVWGISARDIDKYVAEKRVPIINLTELIAAAVFGKKPAGAAHDEFQAHNYYLRHGIGELPEFFLRGATEAGAKVRFGSAPIAIRTEGKKVVAVKVKGPRGEEELPCDFLLSTIPLNESLPLFDAAPDDARAAATALDYCAAVLVFLQIGRREPTPSEMLYLSAQHVRFSRVTDFGRYSKDMVPEGKTLLCAEFPCNLGDALWAASDEALAQEAERELLAAGTLRPGDVEGSFCERVSHSYPRFRVGFQSRVAQCFDFFGRYDNFASYGRQGGFEYLNTDNVVNLGFKAATAVMGGAAMGYTCQQWLSSK